MPADENIQGAFQHASSSAGSSRPSDMEDRIRASIVTNGHWTKMNRDRVEEVLPHVSPIEGKYRVTGDSTSIHAISLPFYRFAILAEFRDPLWPQGTGPFWFIIERNRILFLSGVSDPIHLANDNGNLQINEENAVDYLRFFCFFVHGGEGPFYIVEGLEHPVFDVGQMDNDTKTTLQTEILAPQCRSNPEERGYEIQASIVYSNALFHAAFSVSEGGLVQMLEDRPVAGDLPVRRIKSPD